jgi:predicted YcjX-like family ATPase
MQQSEPLSAHEWAKKIENEADKHLDKGEFALVDSARKYTEAMRACKDQSLGVPSPETHKARMACDVFVKAFESYKNKVKS